MALIKNIMTMPEIFQYAAEDGCTSDIDFTCSGRNVWLLAMDGDDFIGLVNVHIEGSAVAYFHPYVLKAQKRHFKSMCKAFLMWFKENMPPEVVKLNTLIPDYAQAAYKTAISIGLINEGVDRMSYRKHDKIWDRYLMGIIRGEIHE
jgi:hypothetical protein